MRGMLWQSDIEMFGQLDRDGLLPLEVLPHEVIEMLAEHVNEQLRAIRELIPLSSQDWSSLYLDRVPCSVRTRNAIKNAFPRAQLRREYPPSFQNLMDVQGLGAKGVLDFLCSAELALDPTWQPTVEPSPKEPAFLPQFESLNAGDLDQLRARLAEVEREPWLAIIRGDDLRFADLLPGLGGAVTDVLVQLHSSDQAMQTTGQAINRVLPELRTRIEAIAAMTLEDQLLDVVRTAKPCDEHRGRVLLARFGWDGRQRGITLDDAGEAMSVTRERARQVAGDVLKRLPDGPSYLPGLDAALEVISLRLPMPAAEVAERLMEAGLTNLAWTPEALIRVAIAFHRSPTFAVTGAKNRQTVVRAGTVVSYERIGRHVSRHGKGTGPARIDAIWHTLPVELRSGLSESRLLELLEGLSDFVVCDGWCWERGTLAIGLRGPIKQMLEISPTLSLESLRAGLERDFRFDFRRREAQLGCAIELAPLPVLAEYLSGCSEVSLDGDQVRWTGDPLLDVHAPMDVALIELVRSAPDGVADRDTLFAEWRRRGLNRDTLATKLTYVPYLQRVERGHWILRGTRDIPELVSQGYTKRHGRTGLVHECIETTPNHFVVSLSLPVSAEWEAIELPLELADGWDGTAYALEIPSQGVEYELNVTAIGPTPGMAALLERLGARPDEVLQLRVDKGRRRGVAEVMSRADYDARVGDG
jgi:hypothetical protein